MPNLGLAQVFVEMRGDRSVVAQQLGQAPLQVHAPLYLDGAKHPTVFLKSPSSGLLHGDEHRVSIKISDGATLEVRTQASTLVYPGTSRQTISIELNENSSLIFHPHALILARGANLMQDINVSLKRTSHLSYSEHWSAGRIAMNEAWQFEQFTNTVNIYIEQALVYREHWKLRPADSDVTNSLIAGGFLHFKNAYLHGDYTNRAPRAVARPNEQRLWTLNRDTLQIDRTAAVRTIS